MLRREYRFKFYLNARHSVNTGETTPNIHPHTWEIVLHVARTGEGLVPFGQLEGVLRDYLAAFEGRYLNEISPFDTMTPLMENLGEVFCHGISEELRLSGWELLSLEISENPARTYIVRNETEGMRSEDRMAGAVFDETEESCPEDPEKGSYEAQAEELPEEADEVSDEDSNEEINEEVNEEVNGEVNKEVNENAEREIAQTKEESAAAEIQPDSGFSLPLVLRIRRIAGLVSRSVDRAVEKNFTYMGLGSLVVLVFTVLLIYGLTRNGAFPWGSDSWYHLYKGDLLYHSLQKGDFYPLYTDAWYNGIQPLRYWAPLPHYVLALLEVVTGGSVDRAYNLFVGLVFFFGAFGWMLWGVKTGRKKLAFCLALLWFFLPDNLRVLFSEGNLSRVAVTTLFPYLLLGIWMYFESGKRRHLLYIAFITTAITFTHAMIAAMVGITVFLFVLWYGWATAKIKPALHVLGGALCGVMMAGIWLYPALKGGMLSMDQGAVGELMKGLTYPVMETLNPLLRLKSPDSFYFGTSILGIALLGLWLGGRKSRAAFGIAFLIFIGTAREMLPILTKIPMSQLFWMMRFTPLAMALVFAGLLLWKQLRKTVMVLLLLLMLIDCGVSFHLLGHDAPMPAQVKGALDQARRYSPRMVAVLDGSSFGSFPSFYLSTGQKGAGVKQVFGSGWQGAGTARNLVALNTALEKDYYAFLFDRCLEQGADTIVVLNSKVKDPGDLNRQAAAVGYEKKGDTGLCSIYRYPVAGTFGTAVKYDGLAIGKYAGNLAYIFPRFEVGGEDRLDHYSEAQLLQYKTVFLSGFSYDDREKAEQLVRAISRKGVRVIVDLTGAPSDLYSSRAGFLEVAAQPVDFKNSLPDVVTSSGKMALGALPKENPVWRTLYLENLDTATGMVEFQNQQMDVLGTKDNGNIQFLGLNLAYYALETGNRNSVGILEQCTGMQANDIPQRKTVPMEILSDRGSIQIRADDAGVIAPVAYLDALKVTAGEAERVHGLIRLDGKEAAFRVTYPYFKEGLAVSLVGAAGLFLLLSGPQRRGKRRVSGGLSQPG